jgi:hypothetical protein
VAPAPSQNSAGRGRMPAVASGAASAVTRSRALAIIRPSESCRAPGAWIGTYPHTARKRLARFSTVDTPPYPVPKNLPMKGGWGGGDRQGGAPLADAHAPQDDVSAPMGGIQPKHQRSAGPVRANPAEQVGAARQRTDRRRVPAAVGSAVFMRWAGAVIQASQASARVAARAIPAALAPARDDGRSPPRGRPRPRGPGRGAGDAPSAGRGSGSAAAATVLWACGPSTARVFAVHAPDSRSVDVQTILILRDVPSFREDHATDGSARAFGGTETVDTLPANPPLLTHTGRRGRLGVLMPETGDATQELSKKPTPVRAGDKGQQCIGSMLRSSPSRNGSVRAVGAG